MVASTGEEVALQRGFENGQLVEKQRGKLQARMWIVLLREVRK